VSRRMAPAERAAFETAHRSRTMAAVGSARTDVEQQLATAMWRVGVRGWRRGRRTEGARPDFVFVTPRLAVFVDGCFWHGCPRCSKRPVTNTTYWDEKILRNQRRDESQTAALREAQWTVLRFWGHQLEADASACALAVRLALLRNPRHDIVSARSGAATTHNTSGDRKLRDGSNTDDRFATRSDWADLPANGQ
jgi:DNA mismatch endonuclease (patch repair protein)